MDLDVDMYKGGKIDFSKMYPVELYSDTNDPTNPLYKRGYGSFDIHKAIGKLYLVLKLVILPVNINIWSNDRTSN